MKATAKLNPRRAIEILDHICKLENAMNDSPFRYEGYDHRRRWQIANDPQERDAINWLEKHGHVIVNRNFDCWNFVLTSRASSIIA